MFFTDNGGGDDLEFTSAPRDIARMASTTSSLTMAPHSKSVAVGRRCGMGSGSAASVVCTGTTGLSIWIMSPSSSDRSTNARSAYFAVMNRAFASRESVFPGFRGKLATLGDVSTGVLETEDEDVELSSKLETRASHIALLVAFPMWRRR